jgi:hypothetical protein
MKHLQALLLLVVLTASGVAAEGPAPTYRAPRAHDGHPDLQGVWNFASGVPLQRRAAFGDRKLMTKEEFDKERAALLSALGAAAKFAPVENVGFDWIDFSLHVDDLRTSLMTHPDNGRLPALVAGVRRVTTVADILAALADPRDACPRCWPTSTAAESLALLGSHVLWVTAAAGARRMRERFRDSPGEGQETTSLGPDGPDKAEVKTDRNH